MSVLVFYVLCLNKLKIAFRAFVLILMVGKMKIEGANFISLIFIRKQTVVVRVGPFHCGHT